MYLRILLLIIYSTIVVINIHSIFVYIDNKKKMKVRYSLNQINSRHTSNVFSSIRIINVPTINEEEEIHTTLTLPSQLRHSNCKIIVINDHSSDDITTTYNNLNSNFYETVQDALTFTIFSWNGMINNLRSIVLVT